MEQKLTILIIEDDACNLEILTKNVEMCGHNSITEQNGETGLEYLLHTPDAADIVIIDRMMPGMDGIDVARSMRSHPILKETPIIMQSGKVEDDVFKSAFDAGVLFYLQKPFGIREMANFIKLTSARVLLRKLLHSKIDNAKAIDEGAYKIKKIEDAIELSAKIAKLSPDNQLAIAESLYEIMLNSIEHGNLSLGGDQKENLIKEDTLAKELKKLMSSNKNKETIVTIGKKGKKITVTVKDSGSGFKWKPYLKFDHTRIAHLSGRGIYRASKHLKLSYQGNGHEVVCSFSS